MGCGVVVDHAFLSNCAARVGYCREAAREPKLLTDLQIERSPRHKRDAAWGERFAMCGEHRPVMHGLRGGDGRVRIAHERVGNAAALDHEVGFHAEKSRTP